MHYLRFLFLALLKTLGYLFYPAKFNWISKGRGDWDQVSLVLVLNHTSLFEFVYSIALPYRFLWQLSRKLVMPVADVTLKKPISGFIFSRLAPKTISLSRKRDNSWLHFLSQISENDICIFMPEGQMKRRNGLDKHGKPMMVKLGVYELLKKYRGKNMVIVYSKGLRHILAPGGKVPKIFKKIEANLEFLEVDKYLDQHSHHKHLGPFIAKDLQERRDRYCVPEIDVISSK